MTDQRAVLAGGCFWGMQDLFRGQPGVVSTRVGYTGGDVANATYRKHAGHAEAIEIEFDPEVTSYRELLEFFFQIHDPSTRDQQGNDLGSSYRSAIFYTDNEQKAVALDTIDDVDVSGLWPGEVVTEVAPVGEFWEAEPEHQDYLEQYPNGYTCHFRQARLAIATPHRRTGRVNAPSPHLAAAHGAIERDDQRAQPAGRRRRARRGPRQRGNRSECRRPTASIGCRRSGSRRIGKAWPTRTQQEDDRLHVVPTVVRLSPMGMGQWDGWGASASVGPILSRAASARSLLTVCRP